MPTQPDRLGRGDAISADYLNTVAEAIVQRLSVVGGRITRHGSSICLELDEPVRRADGSFWARITGATTDGTNRWLYTFAEVSAPTNGYGTWSEVSAGRSGDARNTLENMNSGSGTLGNGVSVANLAAGSASFDLVACPTGAIVRMFSVSRSTAVAYWFAYANGVDGGCA